ncbi:MAG: class I SAM-dependent methyltransferase [Alphaproteobacteria bacterium]|nr:MAG: class I SAM-dependent methyltransferase [Alphaproteobacteria bacterium]
MSVADFMASALHHPLYGYYSKRDPLGRGGDFTTAPEVSQMFGELIGVWCVQSWRHMGAPDPFILAELGPGRATLLADLLRAAKVEPGFLSAARIHLVELNDTLKEKQRRTLSDIAALGDINVEWHDHFHDLPAGPLLLIANEFFDCLPIRQFVRTARGWCERCIDINREGGFRFVVAPDPLASDRLIPSAVRGAAQGSLVEIGAAAMALMTDIALRLRHDPGRALIIDYGHQQSAVGDTLQAVKNHAYHDVLSDPGEVDVTAHVDFDALRRAALAQHVTVTGPISQGDFFTALGIHARAESLAKNATALEKTDIASALKRLCAPDQMGALFKVLAISSPGLAAPPAMGAHSQGVLLGTHDRS